MMSETEAANLREDIQRNGLLEAIWTYQNQIVDGRNRYNACLATGVEPRFREWNGSGSLVSFVVSLNLHRRHLSESQRAMVAAKLATMKSGERTDLSDPNLPQICGRLSQTDAAELLNVSPRSVSNAAKVIEDGVLDLAERVEAGEISVSAAAQIAELPKTKQKRTLAKKNDKIVNLASQLRVEKTLKKAKSTHDLCLVCNPATRDELNDDLFIAYLQVLARKVSGTYRRYIFSIIEEMQELDVVEQVTKDYELILEAIDEGWQTAPDILRITGLDKETMRYELDLMIKTSMIERVPQGGKNTAARGQVKMLYQRVRKTENQNYKVPEGYETPSSNVIQFQAA